MPFLRSHHPNHIAWRPSPKHEDSSCHERSSNRLSKWVWLRSSGGALLRSFRAWIVVFRGVPGRCPGLPYAPLRGLDGRGVVSPDGAS
jgi:hypothetical protein